MGVNFSETIDVQKTECFPKSETARVKGKDHGEGGRRKTKDSGSHFSISDRSGEIDEKSKA